VLSGGLDHKPELLAHILSRSSPRLRPMRLLKSVQPVWGTVTISAWGESSSSGVLVISWAANCRAIALLPTTVSLNASDTENGWSLVDHSREMSPSSSLFSCSLLLR
jgi:hypothetical protein